MFNKKDVPDELPELIIDKIAEKKTNPSEIKVTNPIIYKEDQQNISINKPDEKKGFFNEIENYLTKEVDDLTQLEKWYENKFLPGDIVTDMREYWKKQKNTSLINNVNKNFQEKILEKTSRLQVLEKEWQNLYFQLIEKEDEIKDQEKELKKMLSELMEIIKKRKEDSEQTNNETV